MAGDLYLGYQGDDANTPFGKFFRPEMAPLPRHVVEALQHGPIAARILGSAESTAGNLLVHCAQEMNHLAAFLPELHAAFGDE